ncbi:XRN 5'-3' exonuclease N-terminus-domain-containing protein [Zopfochytrium polystomum]|nr:XRN 5'-3' exonuclease N-terminus-domain-containing protein [Zopfochytrium polystomum]
MGIPTFFKWLVRSYPNIWMPVREEKSQFKNGASPPVDATRPNPNGVEFDNLYIDVNCLVHPCCKPLSKKKQAPQTEDEMMTAIFTYVDRIVNIVRPRKVLYLSVDGVAPRAKMNHQRAKRFRRAQEDAKKTKRREEAMEPAASKEQVEEATSEEQIEQAASEDDIEETAEDRDEEEYSNPPPFTPNKLFDSNCITPGTPFMSRLTEALKYYIASRLNFNPAWQGVKVILSDASVPGEGEHKIMDYIRRQRVQPEYDPTTRHVVYSQDADMIILALTVHEPHIKVLRQLSPDDKIYFRRYRPKNGVQFGFLHVAILREYLDAELRPCTGSFDLERAIDDWVFLICFLGNDFIPRLPTNRRWEAALMDRLVRAWKSIKPQLGDGRYLTDSGDIDFEAVKLLLVHLMKFDYCVFHVEMNNREPSLEKKKEFVDALEKKKQVLCPSGHGVTGTNDSLKRKAEADGETKEAHANGTAHNAKKLKTARDCGVPAETGGKPADGDLMITEGTLADSEDEAADLFLFESSLWNVHNKKVYYDQKFGFERGDVESVKDVVTKYLESLSWVMKCYYQGVPSWRWFYPYYHSPLPSDLLSFIGDIDDIRFELGEPFKPVEQLMCVLPPGSRSLIPTAFHKLMLDDDSPLKSFFPVEFKFDETGTNRQIMNGVNLLPFVDEKRVIDAMTPLYSELTEEEKLRNAHGNEVLFVSEQDTLFKAVRALHQKQKGDKAIKRKAAFRINPAEANQFMGTLRPDPKVVLPGSTYTSPLLGLKTQQNGQQPGSLQSRRKKAAAATRLWLSAPDIPKSTSISALYWKPAPPRGCVRYVARLRKGVTQPPKGQLFEQLLDSFLDVLRENGRSLEMKRYRHPKCWNSDQTKKDGGQKKKKKSGKGRAEAVQADHGKN